MKKRNKKNHIRMRFSTLLLCCLAFVLCTAPRGWADGCYRYLDDETIYYLDDGKIYDFTEDLDWLEVGANTTVNLNASVLQYVYAGPGSVLNIYSGSIWYIAISPPSPDESNAVVTVYGKNFSVDTGAIDPEGKWLPEGGSGILTVTYSGNVDPIDLWFLSDIAINLKPPQSGDLEEITIDIKPGSNPNNINLKSKGVVPVAILSDSDTNFDATTVDPAKVFFAGAGVAVRGKGDKYLASKEDVNGDGLLDLVVKVETEKLVPGEFEDGGAYLRIHKTADQASPVLYEGWDEIKIVPPE